MRPRRNSNAPLHSPTMFRSARCSSSVRKRVREKRQHQSRQVVRPTRYQNNVGSSEGHLWQGESVSASRKRIRSLLWGRNPDEDFIPLKMLARGRVPIPWELLLQNLAVFHLMYVSPAPSGKSASALPTYLVAKQPNDALVN